MPDPVEQQQPTPPVAPGDVNPGNPEPPATPPATPPDTPPATPPADPQPPATVTLPQTELDNQFAARARQARQAMAKSYGYDTIEAFDTAMKAYKAQEDAQKTEAQRAVDRAEAAEAQNQTLSQRLQTLETREIATSLGVDKDKADDVLALALRDNSHLDENGTLVNTAVSAAITSVLERHPHFKSGPVTIGTGTNPGPAQPPAKNPWSKEHRNLTEQARISKENPALAETLKTQAKG